MAIRPCPPRTARISHHNPPRCLCLPIVQGVDCPAEGGCAPAGHASHCPETFPLGLLCPTLLLQLLAYLRRHPFPATLRPPLADFMKALVPYARNPVLRALMKRCESWCVAGIRPGLIYQDPLLTIVDTLRIQNWLADIRYNATCPCRQAPELAPGQGLHLVIPRDSGPRAHHAGSGPHFGGCQ